MRGLWRRHGAPAVGVYRVLMAMNRQFWIMTVFSALLLPLIVQGAFGQRLESDERTRLLLGNALFGALMISMRRTGIVLVADRIFGYRELLATTSVSRSAYLLAHGLDSLSLALLPLGVLVWGVALGGVEPPASWHWLGAYAVGIASMFALAVLLGARMRSMPSAVLATNLVQWHALGDRLAPKDLWREVLTSPIREGTPGLRTLVVEGSRQATSARWIRIKIEPSVRLPNGIYLEAHEHYEEENEQPEEKVKAASVLLNTLRSEWSNFLGDSLRIADQVLSWSRSH